MPFTFNLRFENDNICIMIKTLNILCFDNYTHTHTHTHTQHTHTHTYKYIEIQWSHEISLLLKYLFGGY